MKRLLLNVMLLFPLFGMGQTMNLSGLKINKNPVSNILVVDKSPVDKLFDKYSDKSGFKRVDISGKLFASMRSNFPPNIVPQLEELYKKQYKILQKITGICILSVEDKTLNKSVNFYKELDAAGFFKTNNYDVLMEVTGKDENVHFFGRNAPEDKYSELLLIIGGKENKVISIRGLIEPMEIGQITSALDVDINKFSK